MKRNGIFYLSFNKKIVLHFFSFIFLFPSLFSQSLVINDFNKFFFYKKNLIVNQNLVTERQLSQLLNPEYQENFTSTKDLISNKILWQTGVRGKAPYFVQPDSYIIIPQLREFFNEKNLSSFNLSFYFKAQRAFKNGTLLRRKEVTENNNNFLPSEFHIYLEDGILKINLKNFFHLGSNFGRKFISLELQSLDLVESKRWHFISLRYNHLNGRLELRINQELVDFAYATENGESYTSIFNPGFEENENDFFLGENYLGLIDEIRFYNENIEVEKIIFNPPTFESVYASRTFKIGPPIRIKRVSFAGDKLRSNEFFLALCFSTTYFRARREFKECRKITWNQDLFFDAYNTYYQFFLVLKNNQAAQKIVKEITLDYEVLPELIPPIIIDLWIQRDKVILNWKRELNPLINEYRIYVTKNPDDLREGRKSRVRQIIVSKSSLNEYLTKNDEYAFSIGELEEGDKYYFAISSYDKTNNRESNFSDVEEIYFNQNIF